MPMSNEAKRRLGDKMKSEADTMRCPKCHRGAALVADWGSRTVWCRWEPKGLCDYREAFAPQARELDRPPDLH